MDKNNKPDIKYSPELKESVSLLKKRHTLTPSDKRKLKALSEKIIRIIEITKKDHPGKTGWKYLESILDNDPDLYPHLRNHVIKVAKKYDIELRIQNNSLYDNTKKTHPGKTGWENQESIGHEAEEIMVRTFEDEYRHSNIEDLEHIPLHVVNKIKAERKKLKYKDKHLTIVSPIEDTEPGCINENDLGTIGDTIQEIETQKMEIMTILKEVLKKILTSEQYEIFDLHVIEQMKLIEIASLKGIKYSRVKQIYRTAKDKAKKDKRILKIILNTL